MNTLNLAVGFVLSILIAGVGYRGHALARSGALGAILVGTIIFGLGGWVWGSLLVAFFVSSSLLSRYRRADKQDLADKFAKGSRRDLGQVLANGGWGALLALATVPNSVWPVIGRVHGVVGPHPLLTAAFVGAMAAVNADTWATELGVLSAIPPRLITTGEVVPEGTSGGITPLGLFASLAGALLIGLLAMPLLRIHALLGGIIVSRLALGLPLAATTGGLAGSLFDSLLGATVQGVYYCDHCVKETESKVHRCGQPTQLRRGWRWLNNDGVNFFCSVVGSLAAVLAAVGMVR